MKTKLNLKENANLYGLFKAIFVSGGPGSGKDLIIRESIKSDKVVEINATLASYILRDKHKLSEHTKDMRREAIRTRQPLVINGTITEFDNICSIKEELEELGYETMMVFVNTTNESSKQRNSGHERMLDESVREDRWIKAQIISQKFSNIFERYAEFDNSLDITTATKKELLEQKENLDSATTLFDSFFDLPIVNETAEIWLYRNKKISANALFEQIVDRTENTPVTTYGKRNREQTVRNQMRNLRSTEFRHDQERATSVNPTTPDVEKAHNLAQKASMQTLKNRLRFEENDNVSDDQTNSKTISTEGHDCSCGGKSGGSQKTSTGYKRLKLLDNICPACQLTAKAGREDSVKDGDIASNTKYTFRTYHEGSEPTIEVKPEPKETRFQQDNDKIKAKKLKVKAAEAGKVLKPAGVSPEYDTRGSGTVYPMSGLGMVTYREQTENKYGSTAEVTRKSFSKFRKESIDSPSVEMGVTGGYHGPSNKEPLETELDKTVNQSSNLTKKKKKK